MKGVTPLFILKILKIRTFYSNKKETWAWILKFYKLIRHNMETFFEMKGEGLLFTSFFFIHLILKFKITLILERWELSIQIKKEEARELRFS